MIRKTITAITAATLATLLSAAPASAAGKAAGSQLTLTYTAAAGYAAAVLLDCHPAGGSHPTPVKACNTLKKVGGKPAKLKPAAGEMCTLEYAPITAEITGRWKGREVQWTQTFGNRCEMLRATGVLFTF